MSKHLFTSESVTKGHPDKICDQISDGILDAMLEQDPMSRVACETTCTTGQVLIMGEITTNAQVDIPAIARKIICDIGYDDDKKGFNGNTCAILTALDKQSPDIAMGVDKSFELKNDEEDAYNLNGAGDQGMMFGYACNETPELMPLPISLANKLAVKLTQVREDGTLPYLYADGKTQVTVEYDDNNRPCRIDTIVVSTQHDDFIAPKDGNQAAADEAMLEQIRHDVINILIPRVVSEIKTDAVKKLFNDNIKYFVNPTGKFVIGGPHGDTGLTGRKIIVDTYGGRAPHGGGAFSGKDPSKVDRSASYAARHIAKNLVAAGVADEMLIQLSYAIGVAEPINIYVNTYGTSHVSMPDGEIAKKVGEMFDLRPKAIEDRLKLRNPIYEETAAYGHFGREPQTVKKTFTNRYAGDKTVEVELFTWEKLDYVDKVRQAFGL